MTLTLEEVLLLPSKAPKWWTVIEPVTGFCGKYTINRTGVLQPGQPAMQVGTEDDGQTIRLRFVTGDVVRERAHVSVPRSKLRHMTEDEHMAHPLEYYRDIHGWVG